MRKVARRTMRLTNRRKKISEKRVAQCDESWVQRLRDGEQGNHSARTPAEKGGSAADKTITEIMDGGSTGLRLELAMHDPTAGKLSVVRAGVNLRSCIVEEHRRDRPRLARRLFRTCVLALKGRVTALHFVFFVASIVFAKLRLSACRGEVCNVATPNPMIFRINNHLLFSVCCIDLSMTCERTCKHTHVQSDMRDVRCTLARLNNLFMETVRTHSRCSLARMCQCMFNHSRVAMHTFIYASAQPATAAQAAVS